MLDASLVKSDFLAKTGFWRSKQAQSQKLFEGRMLRESVTDLMFRKGNWGSNMEEIPPGFRPCSSCTQSCYKEHWPFPNRDSFRAPCFVKALCDSNLAAMATC